MMNTQQPFQHSKPRRRSRLLLSAVTMGLRSWIIQLIVITIVTPVPYHPPLFWTAFMNSWQTVLNLAYVSCGVLFLVLHEEHQGKKDQEQEEQVYQQKSRKSPDFFLAKSITWFFYVVFTTLPLLASALYDWVLNDYDPDDFASILAIGLAVVIVPVVLMILYLSSSLIMKRNCAVTSDDNDEMSKDYLPLI